MRIYVTYIANLEVPVGMPAQLYATLCEPEALYSSASKTKPAYPTNDLLYKGLLEDLFEDFLRFMIPDAENLFDLSRGFDFLNQELDQLFPPGAGEHTTKVVDKLAKVYTKAAGCFLYGSKERPGQKTLRTADTEIKNYCALKFFTPSYPL